MNWFYISMKVLKKNVFFHLNPCLDPLGDLSGFYVYTDHLGDFYGFFVYTDHLEDFYGFKFHYDPHDLFRNFCENEYNY